MSRELKTKTELEQMFIDRLNDPLVSVTVYKSSMTETGWVWEEVIRGPAGRRLDRVLQIAGELQRFYDLKDDGRDT